MDQILFTILGVPVGAAHLLLATACAVGVMLVVMVLTTARTGRDRVRQAEEEAARQSEQEQRLAAIARSQAEMTGRMQTIAEVFGTRQAEMLRHVNERLDGFGHRLGQNFEAQARATHENLSRLHERLAVIDTAQKNITELSKEVVSLQQILANKQTRGAFGQGLMEAIIRDGLPPDSYEFQGTLSNGKRPDCLIRLPGSDSALVVDAKFPLEAFSVFREAQTPEERKAGSQQLRSDCLKHISDIKERYFIPGETQDLAVMFLPSESIYADIHEHFEDVIQKAHRARVIVVGPSMLMLAIQVMQSILRDQRMREQAHLIHKEVAMLADDVGRLTDRVSNLQRHFGQANDDIRQILISADKITKRGDKIADLDFDDGAVETKPAQAQLLAGE